MKSRFESRNIVNGQLKLPTTGSSGGILIGDDVLLYRSAANVLCLADSLIIESNKNIYFRDTGLHIFSSADGELVLVSDGYIYLATGDLRIQDYLRHAGDEDTYMRYSENDIQLVTGGGEMFQVNSAGLAFFGVVNQGKQAHIVDADGTLADITTKFNTLLADLEGYGLLATA